MRNSVMKIRSLICLIAGVICVSGGMANALPISFFPKSSAEIRLEELLNQNLDQKEIDISKSLSLKDCIEIAKERSSRAILSRLSMVSSELSVSDARARYYPSVNLNGSYSFSDRIDFGWEKENYNAGLGFSYTIWDHGQREANLAREKASLKSNEMRQKNTIQELTYSVIVAYYNQLKAGRLVEVNREILDIARKNTERMKALVELGYNVESDILSSEVQEANDELRLIESQNNLAIAEATLSTTIGLDPGSKLQILDDTGYERFTFYGKLEPEELTLEEAIETALKNRPEIEDMKAQREALEWTLFLAQIGRYPTVTAEYSYDVNLDDYLRERENFKNFRSWQAMARLSFPIFDGGAAKRREQRAQIQLRELTENFNSTRRQIILDVRQSYYNLISARKSLEIIDKQVKNAKANLDAVMGRLEVNQATPLEVSEARSLYAQALTNRVRAYYDYKIAQSALRKAMGGLE